MRLLARSLILVLVLGWAADAYAFATQGRRWANAPGEPVSYRLEPNGSDDIADGSDLQAIRNAFATWQSVACSYLSFEELPWVEPKAVANDGYNRIQFVEDTAQWTASQGTLALTFTFYRTSDNVITDADMAINGVHWAFTTVPGEIGTGTPAKVDLETVVFHEVGHYLGLDHSPDPNAAMYATNNKPMQRGPANDDIQGVCSLYPNGMPVPNQGSSGGAVGAPCQSNADCQSSLCAADDTIHRNYCTAQCTQGMSGTCPAGYNCEATSLGNYCLVPVVVDELCDFCEVGGECSTGFCVRVPGYNNERTFCSRPCDPTPGQVTCPDGFSCQPTGGTMAGGACAPNTGFCEPLGKGGQGEVCYANGQCKAGFTCVEWAPGSGLTYCYFACGLQFQGQSCDQGGSTLCDRVAAADNTAVCFPVAHTGQPCIPEICDAISFCAYETTIDAALCYRVCTGGQSDCPAQEMCTQVEGGLPICVPLDGFKYVGDACSSDAECRSGVCRTYGQNQLCTNPCAISNPDDCGPGLKCLQQPGTTQGLCWPQSFIDPNAGQVDRTRPITGNPSFCSCDTTSSCDPDCACDVECTGGCGCTTAEGSPAGALGFLGLLAVALLRRARR